MTDNHGVDGLEADVSTIELPAIVLDGLCWGEGDDTVRWVMALGHVDRSAFREEALNFLGIDEQAAEDFPAAEQIQHRWAVDEEPGSDAVEWSGVTESTPDAYAITLLDLTDWA